MKRFTCRRRAAPFRLAITALCAPLVGASYAAASTPMQPSGPSLVGERIRAAEAAVGAGEPQLAESRYRDALLEAWMALGACAMLDDRDASLEAAEAAFERATRVALEERRPAHALAAVETRRGEADDAIARLRRLLATRPEDVATRRLLARVFSAVGRDIEAVQELGEAAIAAPGDAELIFELATGHLRLGDVDEAAAHFDRLAAARPSAATRVLIGRTWRDFEHYDAARAAFEQALEIDPSVRKARFYQGTVALLDDGRGALGDAIRSFEAELETGLDDPLTHLFLGLALVEVRRFEDALPHLEQAARLGAPTRRDALHFHGKALLGLDRPADAEELLREGLTLADDSTAPNQLAGLHYQLALALRSLGRRDEASVQFEAAREQTAALGEESRDSMRRYLDDTLANESTDAIGGSGTSFGAPTAALPVPTAGLERLPGAARRDVCSGVALSAARAHLNLGVLQARSGRPERAALAFRDALETAERLASSTREKDREDDDPLRAIARQARYALGVALFNAGRHADAAEPLERAWRDETADGCRGPVPCDELRRLLALDRLEREDWAGAAALFDRDPAFDQDRAVRAADSDPTMTSTDPALVFAYGKALVRAGRADDAVAVFDRLATGGAEAPELLVLLGEAHAREGDWPRAREVLRRARERDPAPAGAARSLGEIALRLGELDEAAEALADEVERHPDDLRARLLLGTVYDLQDRHDEAEAQIRRILEARPDDGDARYLLGKILLGRGDADAAALQLEAAADAAPGDFNVQYQLGLAYRSLGRGDAARDAFAEYRRLKAESR